jgi:hypothetical protein
MPGLLRTAVVALALGFAPAMPAMASQICDQLGFALATLGDRSEPAVEALKYARAIAAQKLSLRTLDASMRQTRCSSGSLVVVGADNDAECARLTAKQQRMERNLEILEAKRLSVLSEDDVGARRRQLVAALDDNRCNAEPILVSTPGTDGTAPLVQDETGGMETIRVPSTEPDYDGNAFVDLGGAAANGSFRTMCVRTCDGAYFPVSSHASPLGFRRDAQVCSMMCPGTETELYYHPLTSESEEMRSAMTGRPYADLDNAWRFRTEKPGSQPQCGCNFSLYYQEMIRRQSYIKNPDAIAKPPGAIVWVKPVLRPSLKSSDILAENHAARPERAYRPNAHIRLVGPQFLPDQRIDFTSPSRQLTR